MLLTRLPLPLRGVRLACVRPAASVRSEPGSNSQVESLDSGFGLEVNPRNHLRNGHLHNMISTSASRSKYHGDGIETQSSPESVVISVLRPKSARTPPSAFPFSKITMSKSVHPKAKPSDPHASNRSPASAGRNHFQVPAEGALSIREPCACQRPFHAKSVFLTSS